MLGTKPSSRQDILRMFKPSTMRLFQRVVEGSVISSAKGDLSEDGALSQAMSDDDPDLAPREWSQTGGATAVAQKPPPLPDLPKHSPPRSNAVMRSVPRYKLGTWTRCKLCTPGVRKGWTRCIGQRQKSSSLWRGLGVVRTLRNILSGWIMGSLRPSLLRKDGLW